MFFPAGEGIRVLVRSRGLGVVVKRQALDCVVVGWGGRRRWGLELSVRGGLVRDRKLLATCVVESCAENCMV